MTQRDTRTPLAIALVLMLFGALGVYYWAHKPIAPAQALALASTLADALAAAWLAALGGGLGRRLLRVENDMAPGERLTVQTALGWGVIGLVMLGVGLVRGYYALEVGFALAAASLVLWREMRAWLADAAQAVHAMWLPGRLNRLAALFTFGVLLIALLRALAPPLMWDALVYHLTLPKLYAQTHGLHLTMDFMFGGMPQLTEMLYTAAYLLRGPMAAQTLGWMFGAVLTLGLASHAQAVVGPRYGALAPALLFSSFTIALSLSWAYAETLLMVLGLALLIALRQWRVSREQRWLIIAGALAGLALGCKYTAGILLLGGVAVISGQWIVNSGQWSAANRQMPAASHQPSSASRQRPTAIRLLPSVFFFLLSALCLFSPWLLKNFLFTGNPIFPLFISTPAFDSLRQHFFNRPDLAERSPLWALVIFARAVMLGVQGGNDYDATLSPLLLVFPVGVLFGWRRLAEAVRRELGPVVIFLGAAYACWAALTFTSPLAQQARLFFAPFPALAIVCAGGVAAIAALDAPALRPSVIVSAACALVIALSAFEYGADSARVNLAAYLLGQQSAQKYRESNLGWYAVALEKVNALPAGARVVFLWEPRSLECAAQERAAPERAGLERCAPDTVIDRWWYLRRTVGGTDVILAQWRAEGFTHVLIYDAGVNFVRETRPNALYTAADWAELEILRGRVQLTEAMGDVYSLYELSAP